MELSVEGRVAGLRQIKKVAGPINIFDPVADRMLTKKATRRARAAQGSPLRPRMHARSGLAARTHYFASPLI